MEKTKISVLVFATTVCFFVMVLLVSQVMYRSVVSQVMYRPDYNQIKPASDRFEVVMDGQAVLDKQTSLVWAKNADLGGVMTLEDAKDYCKNLSIGSRRDWRLPTEREMGTLLDSFEDNQPLANWHPFDNVQFNLYWTSTGGPESDTDITFHMGLAKGFDNYYNKSVKHYVWCMSAY